MVLNEKEIIDRAKERNQRPCGHDNLVEMQAQFNNIANRCNDFMMYGRTYDTFVPDDLMNEGMEIAKRLEQIAETAREVVLERLRNKEHVSYR